MKGILSVLAATVAISILVPLVLANAYYKDEKEVEIPVLHADTPDSTQLSEIVAGFEEKEKAPATEAVPDGNESEDEFIFGYDEDDSFALSPLFQVLDKLEKEPAEEEPEDTREPELPEKTPDITISVSGSAVQSDDERNLKVYLHSSKKYVTLSMTEYLYGVVAAEMPSYFNAEALKAQAVASRTYTLHKMLNTNFHYSGHGKDGAHICTNSGHCQAYISREEAEKKWGKAYADQIFNAVCPAVDATKGQVMLYDGTPIFAAYHSMSYKYTDDVENVWENGDYPYLKSVYSPEDDGFGGLVDTVTFKASTFKKYIRAQSNKAEFSDDPSDWITGRTLNRSGRVETLTAGGVEFTGREIQSVFGLRSSNFTVSYDEENEKFVFEVKGRGHGIGMSQYGANLLAAEGYTHSEILNHYYTDITIGSYNFKR